MLEHLSLIVHLSPNNKVYSIGNSDYKTTGFSLSLSLITVPQRNKVCFMGLFPPSSPPPLDNNRTPVHPVTVILILLEQCRNS